MCEIQTDKAVVSMEVDEDGVLAKIVKAADSGSIKVGEVIAVVAEDGEEWQEVASSAVIGQYSCVDYNNSLFGFANTVLHCVLILIGQYCDAVF